MKKLISLLLIVSLSVMSWSSYAKNKANMSATYSLSYPLASSLLSTPMLTTQEVSENLNFPQTKSMNKQNRFFEISIIFNEKLHQIISFYTR